jgi:hypothetical protein
MPLTPFQAFRLSKGEYEVLRLIENKIDEFLEENYFPGQTITVNLPAKTVTDRILHTILIRYEEAGWRIEKKPPAQAEAITLDFSPVMPNAAME